MKKTVIALALALAMPALNIHAQDADGPPPGGPGGPGGSEQGGGPGKDRPHGFHVLPPHAKEALKLTDDQMKQIADLEAEVKEKMEKILTPEQLEQLKKMHPPHPPGGPGGGPDGSGADTGNNSGKGAPGGQKGPGGKPPTPPTGTNDNP